MPGGGVALLRCQAALDKLEKELEGDEKTGALILRKAVEEPMRLIAENAGREGSVVVDAVQKAKKPDVGYDAVRDDYANMFERGIVDPVKVVRAALENAASIAGILLTTESLVTDIPEPPHMAPGGPPPMEY